MAIRYAPKIARYYRRALSAKRRALGSYIAAYSGVNSHVPTKTDQGKFIGDHHYRSNFLSSFRPGSLDSFDLYVNAQLSPAPMWTVCSADFESDPSCSTLQYLSQARNWENLQSVQAQFFNDLIVQLQPQPALLDAADDTAPKKLTEEQERANKRKDNLRQIATNLAEQLPKFFTDRFNYSDCSFDIVFENRIRNITTKGLKDYVVQLNKYKTMSHIVYAHIKLDVLKITEHPEDNTVRVRWRMTMVGGLRPFLTFWKLFTPEGRKQAQEVLDGFSTFAVGEDGKIHKHIADKMMPDDEKVKSRVAPEKLAKLAAFVGFFGLAVIE